MRLMVHQVEGKGLGTLGNYGELECLFTLASFLVASPGTP
jgi:hypothetical protein